MRLSSQPPFLYVIYQKEPNLSETSPTCFEKTPTYLKSNPFEVYLNYVPLFPASILIWLILMYEIIPSYVRHDAVIWTTGLIHMCDMAHSQVWRGSFVWVIGLPHMNDTMHPFVWQDSFTCVTWNIYIYVYIYMCIYTYTHTHTHTHTHTCTRTWAGERRKTRFSTPTSAPG